MNSDEQPRLKTPRLVGSIVVKAANPQTGTVLMLLTAAILTFVISVATMAGASAIRVASVLAPRLSGQFTIAVSSRGLESADAAAARAAERLSVLSGVRRAEVLEADGQDALIAAAMVIQAHGPEQPRLIAIETDPNLRLSADRLRGLLNKENITAFVDEHHGISGPLEREVCILGGLIVASCLLSVGAFSYICFIAGRRTVVVGGVLIDLFRHLGADADFIATRVAREFAMKAAAGAGIGIFCASTFAFVVEDGKTAPSSLAQEVLSETRIGDCLWAAPWLVLVALLAASATRLGARRGILRQERDL